MAKRLLAASTVVLGGFTLGLTLGVVLEDPNLVFDHLLGRTETVALPRASEAGPGPPSAPPALATRRAAETTPPAPRSGERPPGVRPSEAASPPSRAATPDVAAPPPRGGFSIQVGAFHEGATARRLAVGLREAGFPVSVSAGSEAGARWRVRVGPMATRAQAQRLAARLREERGLPTWILAEESR